MIVTRFYLYSYCLPIILQGAYGGQYTYIFFQENAYAKVVYKMAGFVDVSVSVSWGITIMASS